MNRLYAIRLWLKAMQRWKQVMFALTAIALTWWMIDALIVRFPIRSNAMNEYTKSMQTVCVGRYLIDMPSQLNLQSTTQAVNGIQIQRLPKIMAGHGSFKYEMELVERKLREELAKLEYSGILKVTPMGENGMVIVYFRQSRKKRVVEIEAYTLKNLTTYKLKYGSAADDIDVALNEISTLASIIETRDNANIPTSPGLCIDGGFISGKGFDQEEVSADFEERENAGFGFSLKSIFAPSVKGSDFESRIDRIEKQKTRSMFKEAFVNLKTKRNTPIELAGTAGKEWIFTDDLEGAQGLTAMADTAGDGTHLHQWLELQMINSSKNKAEHASTKLSDETAVSVWDAVIKTIRPRSGAI